MDHNHATTMANHGTRTFTPLSSWADPPSAMFCSRPQSEDGDGNYLQNPAEEGNTAADSGGEYAYEADQRAAERLDSLLSNIEQHVDQQFHPVRVDDESFIAHPTTTAPHKVDTTRVTARDHYTNRTTRVKGQPNPIHRTVKTQRAEPSLNDGSYRRLGAQHHHNRAGKKRTRPSIGGQREPLHTHLPFSSSPTTTTTGTLQQLPHARTGQQADDVLNKQMAALDRIMSSVRQTAPPLCTDAPSVPNNQLEEERKAVLENAHGTWQRQVQTLKSKLFKTNTLFKKQTSILTGIKSALRESQLIVTRQAVEAKESKQDILALKNQIRHLRSDVLDAEGIHKEKRIEAESKVEAIQSALEDKDVTIRSLQLALESAETKLANAPPQTIPQQQALGSHVGETVHMEEREHCAILEQRNQELRHRHQHAMASLSQDHDQSVQRLKQHMLKLETGANNEFQKKELERVLERVL